MRQLGLRSVGGALLTDDEIQFQRQVAKCVDEAMSKWRRPLEGWQKAIEGDNAAKREYAVGQLRNPGPRAHRRARVVS